MKTGIGKCTKCKSENILKNGHSKNGKSSNFSEEKAFMERQEEFIIEYRLPSTTTDT